MIEPRATFTDHARLPRLIFCLSPGRCGTKYLAAVLDTIPGVHAVHEGKPDFVDWARAARRDPEIARRFWACEKLPHIISLDVCEVYVETSHLFGKGFVRPLLDLGVVPDVIVLRRNFRDVALSRWRRSSIPARTPSGQLYLLHPEQAEWCHLPRWWTFSDYQLCYWYTLEMEGRTQAGVASIRQAGGKIAFLDFRTLTTGWPSSKRLGKLLAKLGIFKFPEFPIIDTSARNATLLQFRNLFPPGDLDEQEQQVKDAISSSADAMPDPRQKVDVIVLTMGSVCSELMMTLLDIAHNMRYNINIGHSAANPTANNRCRIAREFIDNERRADWVMMIDEDTVPNGDFLKWTENTDYDVISFMTPCWKPTTSPESAIVWNVQMDDREQFAPAVDGLMPADPREHPIIDVVRTGTGAMLIRRKVLEHPGMRAPFRDVFDEYGIRAVGHDIEFCKRAKRLGFKVGTVLESPASHYKVIDLLNVVRLTRRSKQ